MARKKQTAEPERPASMAELISQYAGLGARMGSDPSLAVEFIPTGIPTLDKILGGGIPRNRISIWAGNYATGKTFLMQKAIAECQKSGGLCGLVDAEMKLDQDWVTQTGVDLDNLLVLQSNLGEEVLNTVCGLVEHLDLLVVDSLAALVPIEEVAKGIEDKRVASQARMIKEFMQRVLPHLNKNKTKSRCALVFINQISESIGGYVPTQNYPGGNAQKFYSSQIIRVSRGGWEKVPGKIGGKEIQVKVGFDIICRTEKNSLTTPFQTVTIPFHFDGTVDPIASLLGMAVDEGLIIQAGPFYSYKDMKEQGKSAFADAFRKRQDLIDLLQEELVGVTAEEDDDENSAPF